MKARALPALVLVLVLSALMLAGAAKPVPSAPVASCSPGPADCFDWHNSNVTVSWSVSSCPSVTISSDTGGSPVSCTVSDPSGSVTTTVNVRRDATPPRVGGRSSRDPDSNGWYNKPFTIEFTGSDALSGVAGCTSVTYSGPDSPNARLTGSCTDGAGNTGSTSYEVKYDATAPTVEAKPDRKPNGAGWYNRAVKVAFVGTDPVSGVDSCIAPVEYKGPDTDKTSISGTCRDKAANTSQPVGYELRYDSKPPSLGRVRSEITQTGVVLRWTASKDSQTFSVLRRPGLRGKKPSTIYTGKAKTFTDRRLQNGVKYRYTVTAYDQAGNGAAKALLAQPKSVKAVKTVATPTQPTPSSAKPALRAPAPGARVKAPPLLSWTAVPNATYYNVQLYRDGKKILTAWPHATQLRLQASWTFDGRRYTLSPGRYRWYVWPGYGSLSANRYGKLVGTRSFVVTGP
jgi:hypothetical protein